MNLLSMSRILPVTPENLKIAAAAIQTGSVVAFPTETLYGLAVDALNPMALQCLAQVKGRKLDHTVALLVADMVMLKEVVRAIPARASILIERYWPGPVTFILPANPQIPSMIQNDRGGVGVRISSDPIAHELVRLVGKPITATSANLSGKPAATRANEAVLAGVECGLDDGPRHQLPSTIVEVLGEEPVIVRQGGVRVELMT